MMGKNFWEDAEIDAIEIEMEVNRLALMLYEQYGHQFDEIDVLQMNNVSPGTARDLILKAVMALILERQPEIARSPSL